LLNSPTPRVIVSYSAYENQLKVIKLIMSKAKESNWDARILDFTFNSNYNPVVRVVYQKDKMFEEVENEVKNIMELK